MREAVTIDRNMARKYGYDIGTVFLPIGQPPRARRRGKKGSSHAVRNQEGQEEEGKGEVRQMQSVGVTRTGDHVELHIDAPGVTCAVSLTYDEARALVDEIIGACAWDNGGRVTRVISKLGDGTPLEIFEIESVNCGKPGDDLPLVKQQENP